MKIQENSDKLTQLKTDIESNYNYIRNLQLNADKNKASISTNNKEITNIRKNINGNYIVSFIDNKILNIAYTKYVFKNIAGYNNKYMIYESSSEVNSKEFSYIEFKLKLFSRYNKYRYIGTIKVCIKFYDKNDNEIYVYQILTINMLKKIIIKLISHLF